MAGACMAGGGAYMAGEAATALDSTHHTGMHSCLSKFHKLNAQFH